MQWWPCKRSRQRLDDLLVGRNDPEALFLRLHVRFCPHCKPWFRYERQLEDGLRRKASPPFRGTPGVLEALRSEGNGPSALR